ncbi:hypothetical protein BC834DRAFT_908964 [Gloeopeniophorella convolvens]|nr:hypothetical protein BC834DRAFT_908964 [Gloeopeniophorella convolvens]
MLALSRAMQVFLTCDQHDRPLILPYHSTGRHLPNYRRRARWWLSGMSCTSPVRSFLFPDFYKSTRCNRRRLRSLRNHFPIPWRKLLLGFFGMLLYNICAIGVIAITSGTHLGCGTRSSLTVKEWVPDKVRFRALVGGGAMAEWSQATARGALFC